VLPCSGERSCSVEGDASSKGFLEAVVPPLITIVALLAIGSLVSGGLLYHFKILNVTISGSMMGGGGLVLSVCVIGWIVRSVKNTRSHPTAPPVTHPAESSVTVSVKPNEMAAVGAPSTPSPSCPDRARMIDPSKMAEPQLSCSPVATLPMPIGAGLWNKPKSLTVQMPTWSSQFIDSMKIQFGNYRFLTPQEIKLLIEKPDAICLFDSLCFVGKTDNLSQDQQYGQTEKWNLRYVARQQVGPTMFEIFSYINVIVFLNNDRHLMYCDDTDTFNPREARDIDTNGVIRFTKNNCQIVVYKLEDPVCPTICATDRDIGVGTKIQHSTFEIIDSCKPNEMVGVSAPSMPPPSCPDGARMIDLSKIAEPQPSCSPVATSQGQDHMRVARSTSPTPSVVNLGHLHADVQKRWIAFLPLRDALVMSRVNKVFQTIFAEGNGDIWENLCPPQCRWKNASATWKEHCLSFLPMPIGAGLWNKPRSLTVQMPTWSSQFIDSMKTQVENYKFLTPQEIKLLIEQPNAICLLDNIQVVKNTNNLREDQKYGQTEKWNLRYVTRQQVDSTTFEIFSYINVMVFLNDNRQLMYCNDTDTFNPREARDIDTNDVMRFTKDNCQIVVYKLEEPVCPTICATNRDMGQGTTIAHPTFEIIDF
jgi:hypothetical protein